MTAPMPLWAQAILAVIIFGAWAYLFIRAARKGTEEARRDRAQRMKAQLEALHASRVRVGLEARG